MNGVIGEKVCDSIGYGISSATQFTNPQKIAASAQGGYAVLPQADPNGLFSPASAEGTWVLCKVPGSDKIEPQYIELEITETVIMRDEAWSEKVLAALRAVGGTHGVGVTFLEETFGAATASPAHRSHERAARAVLQTLLPEPGADIKGRMRSHDRTAIEHAFATLVVVVDRAATALSLNDRVRPVSLAGERVLEVADQVAVELADAVLFVVDAMVGPTSTDERVVRMLRASGKPVILVANKIALGQIECGIAGGVDTTSDAPIGVNEKMRKILMEANRAKGTMAQLKVLSKIRPSMLVKPAIPKNGEISVPRNCSEPNSASARTEPVETSTNQPRMTPSISKAQEASRSAGH